MAVLSLSSFALAVLTTSSRVPERRKIRISRSSITNTGPWELGAYLGNAALAQVVFFELVISSFFSSFLDPMF